MKFHNDNLDYTVGKYNNPYSLIQKAGLRKKKFNSRSRNRRITKRRKVKKTRKNF